ncbi:MAG TPA: Ig-like domain-containing protein, partial [Thermoplasmata archaeon]|nr:Ig-like domain-containing protein [Thermoplasmata archaeon]
SLESFTVVGLTPSTRYWFALKTSDEVPNWSPLSNVVDAVTWTPPPPPDTTPPARITDLGVTVTGTQSVSLHWTAPGDDGTAGTATSYDARYSSSGPLTDANFASGTSIATPMPGLAGTSETVNLGGLTPSTRYWFAIRTRDEVPNWALISNVPDATTQTLPDTTLPTVGITTPVNGATVSGNVQVTASAADNVAVASVDLYVDGAFFASSLSPPYAWVWPSVGLSEGAHLLRAMATDTSGNQQNASANVDVRNAVPTPPTVLSAGWDANRSWVEIEFSQPMNRTSVEANLATSPIAEHTVLWANDSHLFVALTGPITPGTKYTVMISIGARDTQGTGMAEGFTYEFIPSPQASSENPWYLIELLLVLSLIITSVGVLSTRHRVNALDRASARRTH